MIEDVYVNIPAWGFFCPVTLAVAVTATAHYLNRIGLRSELRRHARLTLAAEGVVGLALLLVPLGLSARVGCSDVGGSIGLGRFWLTSLVLAVPMTVLLDRSYILAGKETRDAMVATAVTVLGLAAAALLEFMVATLSVVIMCNEGSLALVYVHAGLALLIPVAGSAWTRFAFPAS